MAKSLSQTIIAAKNELNQSDPWLSFIKVTMPDDTNVFLVNNNENITWPTGGQLYTALPFKLSSRRFSNDSAVPGLTIQVTNATKALVPYLEQFQGFSGAEIELNIVNTGHLDEDYSELTVKFKVVGTDVDVNWVTFKLGVENPLRQRFPLYTFMAGMCNWAGHFKGAECQYVGVETECNGTWEDCVERVNEVRFGGCKGLSGGGLRIA